MEPAPSLAMRLLPCAAIRLVTVEALGAIETEDDAGLGIEPQKIRVGRSAADVDDGDPRLDALLVVAQLTALLACETDELVGHLLPLHPTQPQALGVVQQGGLARSKPFLDAPIDVLAELAASLEIGTSELPKRMRRHAPRERLALFLRNGRSPLLGLRLLLLSGDMETDAGHRNRIADDLVETVIRELGGRMERGDLVDARVGHVVKERRLGTLQRNRDDLQLLPAIREDEEKEAHQLLPAGIARASLDHAKHGLARHTDDRMLNLGHSFTNARSLHAHLVFWERNRID